MTASAYYEKIVGVVRAAKALGNNMMYLQRPPIPAELALFIACL